MSHGDGLQLTRFSFTARLLHEWLQAAAVGCRPEVLAAGFLLGLAGALAGWLPAAPAGSSRRSAATGSPRTSSGGSFREQSGGADGETYTAARSGNSPAGGRESCRRGAATTSRAADSIAEDYCAVGSQRADGARLRGPPHAQPLKMRRRRPRAVAEAAAFPWGARPFPPSAASNSLPPKRASTRKTMYPSAGREIAGTEPFRPEEFIVARGEFDARDEHLLLHFCKALPAALRPRAVAAIPGAGKAFVGAGKAFAGAGKAFAGAGTSAGGGSLSIRFEFWPDTPASVVRQIQVVAELLVVFTHPRMSDPRLSHPRILRSLCCKEGGPALPPWWLLAPDVVDSFVFLQRGVGASLKEAWEIAVLEFFSCPRFWAEKNRVGGKPANGLPAGSWETASAAALKTVAGAASARAVSEIPRTAAPIKRQVAAPAATFSAKVMKTTSPIVLKRTGKIAPMLSSNPEVTAALLPPTVAPSPPSTKWCPAEFPSCLAKAVPPFFAAGERLAHDLWAARRELAESAAASSAASTPVPAALAEAIRDYAASPARSVLQPFHADRGARAWARLFLRYVRFFARLPCTLVVSGECIKTHVDKRVRFVRGGLFFVKAFGELLGLFVFMWSFAVKTTDWGGGASRGGGEAGGGGGRGCKSGAAADAGGEAHPGAAYSAPDGYPALGLSSVGRLAFCNTCGSGDAATDGGGATESKCGSDRSGNLSAGGSGLGRDARSDCKDPLTQLRSPASAAASTSASAADEGTAASEGPRVSEGGYAAGAAAAQFRRGDRTGGAKGRDSGADRVAAACTEGASGGGGKFCFWRSVAIPQLQRRRLLHRLSAGQEGALRAAWVVVMCKLRNCLREVSAVPGPPSVADSPAAPEPRTVAREPPVCRRAQGSAAENAAGELPGRARPLWGKDAVAAAPSSGPIERLTQQPSGRRRSRLRRRFPTVCRCGRVAPLLKNTRRGGPGRRRGFRPDAPPRSDQACGPKRLMRNARFHSKHSAALHDRCGAIPPAFLTRASSPRPPLVRNFESGRHARDAGAVTEQRADDAPAGMQGQLPMPARRASRTELLTSAAAAAVNARDCGVGLRSVQKRLTSASGAETAQRSVVAPREAREDGSQLKAPAKTAVGAAAALQLKVPRSRGFNNQNGGCGERLERFGCGALTRIRQQEKSSERGGLLRSSPWKSSAKQSMMCSIPLARAVEIMLHARSSKERSEVRDAFLLSSSPTQPRPRGTARMRRKPRKSSEVQSAFLRAHEQEKLSGLAEAQMASVSLGGKLTCSSDGGGLGAENRRKQKDQMPLVCPPFIVDVNRSHMSSSDRSYSRRRRPFGSDLSASGKTSLSAPSEAQARTRERGLAVIRPFSSKKKSAGRSVENRKSPSGFFPSKEKSLFLQIGEEEEEGVIAPPANQSADSAGPDTGTPPEPDVPPLPCCAHDIGQDWRAEVADQSFIANAARPPETNGDPLLFDEAHLLNDLVAVAGADAAQAALAEAESFALAFPLDVVFEDVTQDADDDRNGDVADDDACRGAIASGDSTLAASAASDASADGGANTDGLAGTAGTGFPRFQVTTHPSTLFERERQNGSSERVCQMLDTAASNG